MVLIKLQVQIIGYCCYSHSYHSYGNNLNRIDLLFSVQPTFVDSAFYFCLINFKKE